MKKPKPLHTDYQFGKSFRFYNIFSLYCEKNLFWFRLFGYGVSGRHYKTGISFLERYAYKPHFVVFGWRLSILKPK